ncbi:MAG: transcriptional regulator protein [Candidatus Methanoperedens sp.]|nr:transcriptional regulator protein [Candidatus Methanoperedens sp.]MCZ7394203.1 transcriptional regulator protein [Candidatus Methanoperedens sp.]
MTKNGTIARALAYLNNGDEATSVELETGTGLRQPEVSIVMRQLKERDWINEREEKKQGNGRPYKIYSLKSRVQGKFKPIDKARLKKNVEPLYFSRLLA